MPKRKLYLFILGFALTGISWVFLNHYLAKAHKTSVNICLFRQVTGIPCPSCGTTHAVLSIAQGRFGKAAYENILGYPLLLVIIILPLWILADLYRKKDSFYRFYRKAEIFLRKKWIAWPVILLLLINWGWHVFRNG
jgi:hypothetical protein